MNTVKTLAMTSLLALSAIPAVAHGPLTAKIPFDFTVSGRTMPAGEYTVTAPSASIRVTTLRSTDSGKSVLASVPIFAPWAQYEEPKPAKLTFSCLANHCALSGVTSPNGEAQIFPEMKLTSREKETLAKQEIPLTPKGQ